MPNFTNKRFTRAASPERLISRRDVLDIPKTSDQPNAYLNKLGAMFRLSSASLTRGPAGIFPVSKKDSELNDDPASVRAG